ncbi:PEP-CTERM sorting domain-containing protein [Paremcibacter congregatus]|nr:PEP-CTERM sorting domain-containing protein [Paremcibacter congregatus]
MFKKILLIKAAVLVMTSFTYSAANATYIVGGPTANLQTQNGSYRWDGGSFVTDFRNALENPNNFGPTGTVNTTVDTVDVDLSTGNMSGLDGFLVPWWSSAESAAYDQRIVDFFLAGGDLWLLQDSSGRDGVGALLGLPTVGQTGALPVSGTPLLFDGPFGVATSVTQGGGEEGYLSTQDVLDHSGTVAATNTADQVIAAVWAPGQYAAGAGSLIVVADIDMFTTQADFDAMNGNAIFTLNAFAFLATSQDVPEPASLALLGFGLVSLAFVRRRRY